MGELTFKENELLSIAPKNFEFNKEQELHNISATNYDIAIARLDEEKSQKDITLAKKAFRRCECAGCIISAPNNTITTICLASLCLSPYPFMASRLN